MASSQQGSPSYFKIKVMINFWGCESVNAPHRFLEHVFAVTHSLAFFEKYSLEWNSQKAKIKIIFNLSKKKSWALLTDWNDLAKSERRLSPDQMGSKNDSRCAFLQHSSNIFKFPSTPVNFESTPCLSICLLISQNSDIIINLNTKAKYYR